MLNHIVVYNNNNNNNSNKMIRQAVKLIRPYMYVTWTRRKYDFPITYVVRVGFDGVGWQGQRSRVVPRGQSKRAAAVVVFIILYGRVYYLYSAVVALTSTSRRRWLSIDETMYIREIGPGDTWWLRRRWRWRVHPSR